MNQVICLLFHFISSRFGLSESKINQIILVWIISDQKWKFSAVSTQVQTKDNWDNQLILIWIDGHWKKTSLYSNIVLLFYHVDLYRVDASLPVSAQCKQRKFCTKPRTDFSAFNFRLGSILVYYLYCIVVIILFLLLIL